MKKVILSLILFSSVAFADGVTITTQDKDVNNPLDSGKIIVGITFTF
jgi:hypothetical protein